MSTNNLKYHTASTLTSTGPHSKHGASSGEGQAHFIQPLAQISSIDINDLDVDIMMSDISKFINANCDFKKQEIDDNHIDTTISHDNSIDMGFDIELEENSIFLSHVYQVNNSNSAIDLDSINSEKEIEYKLPKLYGLKSFFHWYYIFQRMIKELDMEFLLKHNDNSYSNNDIIDHENRLEDIIEKIKDSLPTTSYSIQAINCISLASPLDTIKDSTLLALQSISEEFGPTPLLLSIMLKKLSQKRILVTFDEYDFQLFKEISDYYFQLVSIIGIINQDDYNKNINIYNINDNSYDKLNINNIITDEQKLNHYVTNWIQNINELRLEYQLSIGRSIINGNSFTNYNETMNNIGEKLQILRIIKYNSKTDKKMKIWVSIWITIILLILIGIYLIYKRRLYNTNHNYIPYMI